MRPGLGRGDLAEVPFALSGFFRGDFCRRLRDRLLLHGRVHLGFSRRQRRLLVGLDSGSDHLPVDQLVAVNVGPDSVGIRPARYERRRRGDFRRGGLRLFRRAPS